MPTETDVGQEPSAGIPEEHTFFAFEASGAESDTHEYQQLCAALLNQLRPQTKLQQLAAPGVIYCAWQCKLAARAEGFIWSQILAPETLNESDVGTEVSPISGWFGASRENLRIGIQLLKQVRASYIQHNYLRHEYKRDLTTVFGEEFVKLIEDWEPTDLDVVLCARMLVAKHRAYGISLGDLLPKVEKGEEEEEGKEKGKERVKEFLPDPEQSLRTVLKLIDLHLMFLQELRHFANEPSAKASSGKNVGVIESPHYFAVAMNNFRCVLEWYQQVRTEGW